LTSRASSPRGHGAKKESEEGVLMWRVFLSKKATADGVCAGGCYK